MRYVNKRIAMRSGNGRFRKSKMSDVGLEGVCPVCSHFLLRHYDGDERDPNPDPRKFRNRCFTCEPLTDEEKKLKAEIEAAKPKQKGLIDLFREAENAISADRREE